MAIRIITVASKGIVVSASTPSYTAKQSFPSDGVKIVADGFGYSSVLELSEQRVNPILYDTFSFTESIDYTWIYSKAYADTATFSDEQIFTVSKNLADTATVTDSSATNMQKAKSDTFSILEELLFTRIVFLTFEDVIVFSEDFNNTGEHQQWVHFSEIRELLYSKGLEETILISDSTVNSVVKNDVEAVTILEEASVGFRSLPTDTVTISTDGAVSLQDYFASDYIVGSGDQPYISSYQSSI